MRRSGDRFETVAPARPDAAAGWAMTRHSFSFGEHYDPDDVGFEALVALNDETVRAGEAYPPHRHADVEIVTWVVAGDLVHTEPDEPDGAPLALAPGEVARLSAGTGVRHTEGADVAGPVRFVQAWLRPDEVGGEPSYVVGGVADELLAASWVLLASGADPDAVVDLRSRRSSLWATRLAPGATRDLPAAPAAYALLVRGAVDVAGVGPLEEGDALALTEPAAPAVTAREPAELLVWTFAS